MGLYFRTLGLFLFFLNFQSSKGYVILLHDVFSSNKPMMCFLMTVGLYDDLIMVHRSNSCVSFPFTKKTLSNYRSWQCIWEQAVYTIFVLEKKKEVIVHRQEKLEGSTIELVPNWFAFKICRAKDLSSQS